MPLALRRTLMVLAVLVMLTGTALLAESLLLRVTDVRVTGDAVYAEEDIKAVCGFKDGDNLLFIPAKDRLAKLEAQLPYIEKAKISRRIPGTVVIEITAAQPVCSIQSAGGWLLVSGSGKVLESLPAPKEGILQVSGLSPVNTQPGQILGMETQEAADAFGEILEKIAELDAAGSFTRLVMSDLSDIRLWYQDRVECRLGNAVQLDYKLQTAYDLLTEGEATSGIKGIGQNQTGSLDLSGVPETRKSYFTEEAVTPPGGATVTPAPVTPAPASPTPKPSPTPTPEEANAEPEPEPEPDPDWDDDWQDDGDAWTEPDGGWDDENGWEDGGEDWTEPEPDEGGWTGGDGDGDWTGGEGDGGEGGEDVG